MNVTNKQMVLVGFANAGKSTLFNQLTDAKQKTGNWTGVTVAKASKSATINNETWQVTDLPGISNLTAQAGQDVAISHQHLAQQDIECLVNVVDATQLRRQMYLTVQLLSLNVPMVVVLNKSDRKEAVDIDCDKLAAEIGCPVIAVSSLNQEVKPLLAEALAKLSTNQQCPVTKELEATLELSEQNLVEYEKQLIEKACDCQQSQQDNLRIVQQRFSYIDKVIEKASVATDSGSKLSLSERLDSVILHPLTGVPVFLGMMYLLFMFAINVGGAFIDFFDILGGYVAVDLPMHLIADTGLPMFIQTIIEGFGMGIQTVLTFVPIIISLFIGLSLLESSGYLARAAFVVDSAMHKIGLPGKAFVPLIVGFGCTVPAVMSARILDSERDRIRTVMMSPFMSCGARLPVYALFAAAFFPESGQNLVFLLYLIGIFAALATGLLLKKTVLPGAAEHHMMELPSYEMPSLARLIKRVADRTLGFVKGAGQTIVLVVCILNFFNSLGSDGEFGHQDTEQSVLSQAAHVITPVLSPLGVKEDNWQASVGLVTGIFAKEALVATFNSLYSPTAGEDSELTSFGDVWSEAASSIGGNLGDINAQDPLGVDVGDVETIEVAAEEQEVEITTFTRMQAAFAGQLGAFSYLLFILLYTPCAAAMGAIRGEVGNRWAAFAALWSLGLAYMCSTAVYQIGVFASQPITSAIYLVVIAAVLIALYHWLKGKGQRVLILPVKVTY